jgi:hypothetical protein
MRLLVAFALAEHDSRIRRPPLGPRLPPSTAPALALALLVGICAACAAPAPDATVVPGITAGEHRAVVEAWRAKRHASLEQPDGWLSLVGLMWLEEGDNTFGADPGNDLVYDGEGVPARLGTFTVDGEVVRFQPEAGITVGILGEGFAVEAADRSAGEAASAPSAAAARSQVEGPAQPAAAALIMRQPAVEGAESSTPIATWGTLQWFVMRREGQFVVRMKDSRSPVLLGFEGVEMFPIDRAWRFEARFEPYEPAKTIMIPNILGSIGEGRSPGAVVFEAGGETHRLDMWKDSDDPANFFTAFADQTNRRSTYGGGRFIWVDAPDEDGRTVIDFNRAYNPPCVFTPYATCPLPPEQNRLPLAIEAGEKIFESPGAAH